MNKVELNEVLKLHKLWLETRFANKVKGERANLSGANLRRADLRGANLIRANLSEADLRDANLRDANLSGANLRDANLRDANLSGANLNEANLTRADLNEANLNEANLTRADLNEANLIRANLIRADISGADLSGADLSGADFSRADLSGVDLDFSCLPLWCGSLEAKFDKKHYIQFLYHTLKSLENNDLIEDEFKKELLTEQNIKIANRFHRVEECGTVGQI